MNHSLTKEQAAEMEAATERGIEQGYAHAVEAWRRDARAIIMAHALANKTFTVNDLRESISKLPVPTQDGRALGGVINALRRELVILPSGETVPSIRGHKSRIQIWRSNIYRADEQSTMPL